MNTGIQDAFSLGWMLAYVLRGFAGPALLDTYGPERLEAKALRAKVSDSNETLFAERSHLKQHLRNAAYRVIGQFEPLIDTMLERNFQMRLGFRKSPGVREFAGLPAHLTAPHDLEHGTCMAEWLAFGRGPRAGDRAPNAELSGEDGSTTRLFDLLAHPCHDLLVFTGTEPLHDQTTQQIESLVRLVAEKYAEWMRTHVIAADGAPEFSATTWRDRTGTASKRYGARGACVYLVRPDGYVGFRSLPPDPARLKEYVSTVLQPPA